MDTLLFKSNQLPQDQFHSKFNEIDVDFDFDAAFNSESTKKNGFEDEDEISTIKFDTELDIEDISIKQSCESDVDLDENEIESVDKAISLRNSQINNFSSDFNYDLSDVAANKNKNFSSLNYLNNIDRNPLLTHEEVVDLSRKIRAGDQHALDKLIRSNLKLVVNVVKKSFLSKSKSSFTFDDLVQEGNIGLMKAAVRFNPELGIKFSTYAVIWIKQNIGRAISYKSLLISVPAHVNERIYKAKKNLEIAEKEGADNIFELQKKYKETVNYEISGHTHMLHGSQDIGSLDASQTEDDSMPTLGETISAEAENPQRRYEIIQCIELMNKALNSIHNETTEPTCPITENANISEEIIENNKKAVARKIFELYSGLNDKLESLKLIDIANLPEINLPRDHVRRIYLKARDVFLKELTVLSGGLENLPIEISFCTRSEIRRNNIIT